MQRPVRPFLWVALLTIGLLLWGGTWLAYADVALSLGIFLGQLVILYGLLRILLGVGFSLWYRQAAWHFRQTFWLVLGVTAAMFIGLGSDLRWLTVVLHRPLLDQYAHHLYNEIPLLEAPEGPVWIGLIRARSVRVSPAGVDLIIGEEMALHYDEDADHSGDMHITGRWFVAWQPWLWGDRPRDG